MNRFIRAITALCLGVAVFCSGIISFAYYDADAELSAGRPGTTVETRRATAYREGAYLTEEKYASMMAAERDNGDVIETLCQGLRARIEEINISTFQISKEVAEDCYNAIMNGYPEFFYVDIYFDMWIDENGNIESIVPRYTIDEATAAEIKSQIDAEVERVCAGIRDGMSREDIITAVHQYFVDHYDYDYENLNDESYTRKFTIMALFLDKKAVCQGFTLGMKYVLSRYNIPCMAVQSKPMQHIWNLVQAHDGSDNWYHVDVTWDNDLNNNMYLFLSDNAIKSRGIQDGSGNMQVHYDYNPDGLANDDLFDNMPLRNSYGTSGRVGDYWYYFGSDASGWYSSGQLMRYNYVTGIEEAVSGVTVEPGWTPKGYGGMSYGEVLTKAVVHNGIVFYNTPLNIMQYDPQTGKVSVFAEMPEGTVKNESCIYDLKLEGNNLIYIVGDDFYVNYTEHTITLPSGESKIEVTGSSVNAQLSGIGGTNKIYIAYFSEDGRFLGVHSKNHDGSVEVNVDDNVTDRFDTVRVFAWKGKQEPTCDVLVAP